MAQKNNITGLRRNLRLLIPMTFLEEFNLVTPVIVIFFEHITGSYALAMAVLSTVFVSQAVLEVPTGYLSDKFLGRKYTLFSSSVCTLFSLICFIIASYYSQIVFLFLGAIFTGAARSFSSGTFSAYLFETLTGLRKKEKYADVLGRIRSFEHMGTAVAASLSGFALIYSYDLALWLSLPGCICLMILTLFLTETRSKSSLMPNIVQDVKTALKHFNNNARLRWLSISNITGYAFGESGYQFYPAFMQMVIPVWLIAWVRVIENLCAMISYWFSGRILRRFGALKIMIWTSIFGPFVSVTAVWLKSFYSPFMIAFLSLDHGVTTVTTSKLNQQNFTDEQRATLESMVSMFGSLAFGVVSIFIGWLADMTDPMVALTICLIVPSCVAVPVYLFIDKKYGLEKHKT